MVTPIERDSADPVDTSNTPFAVDDAAKADCSNTNFRVILDEIGFTGPKPGEPLPNFNELEKKAPAKCSTEWHPAPKIEPKRGEALSLPTPASTKTGAVETDAPKYSPKTAEEKLVLELDKRADNDFVSPETKFMIANWYDNHFSRHARKATMSEYDTWLKGYEANGGKTTTIQDWNPNRVHIATSDMTVPDLPGQYRVHLIVPDGINVNFLGQDDKVYHMNGFKLQGGHVPKYYDK